MGDGQAQAQARHAPGLRQGLEDDEIGNVAYALPQGRDAAEIDVGFIQHHDAGEAGGQVEDLAVGEGVAARIVGAAKEDELRVRVRGGQQGLAVQAEVGPQEDLAHRNVVGRCGYLVHPVTGADGHGVVSARRAEETEHQVDRLVTAVAEEEALRRDALERGKALLQGLLARVRIAVDAILVGILVGVQEDVGRTAAFVPRRAVGGEGRDVGAQ